MELFFLSCHSIFFLLHSDVYASVVRNLLGALSNICITYRIFYPTRVFVNWCTPGIFIASGVKSGAIKPSYCFSLPFN